VSEYADWLVAAFALALVAALVVMGG